MAFTLQLDAMPPAFNLPGTDGRNHSLAEFASAKALVIDFTCNHCPYVVGSEARLTALVAKYKPKGVAFVAINSNETDVHTTDALPFMIERAKEKKFDFPYLRDDDQKIALAYGALRTPHFYVFAKDAGGQGGWRLAYTGRMDDDPRNPGKQTTHELADALDAVLAGKKPAVPLTNPIGCNVKWKNQDNHWMPAEACDLV
ncbi:MAG TPA: thioredoxin family protein [Tepidisphaeraceae bacterium]|jgi:peroxiredoxin|nr:thioredoxin family protein [Tepidisphaeraceae bacterium]